MRTARPVPPDLASRAFTRQQAAAAGITSRMLQHPRFVQVHPSVYRLAGVELDERGRIDAARLALPPDARLSHATRLRVLGVSRGPFLPLHFTVARDLHLAIPSIMLHRTLVMPPGDEGMVCVEAAYVGHGATARLIDQVAIGDWLIHRGHLTIASLRAFAQAAPWRPGAAEVDALVTLLDGRSRSLPESDVRMLLWASGLPTPQVNVDVHDDGGTFLGCADLLLRRWKVLVEHEGGQHFADADQIASDVDRYARFRRDGWAYVQVTKRHLTSPRTVVRVIHRTLVAQGYRGAAPDFGRRWDALFRVPRVRRRPWEVDMQRSRAS